jgi:hypothetical protein
METRVKIIMKNAILRQLALVLPISLGFATMAKATPVPDFVMTEISDTSLSYSIDGGPLQYVTATSPDNWTISLPNYDVLANGPTQNSIQAQVNWEEPDYGTSGQVNYVDFNAYNNPDNGSTVTIVSDTTPVASTVLANAAVYTFDFPGNLTAQFIDDGDSACVPDGGSTAMLFGTALIGLGALRRRIIRD